MPDGSWLENGLPGKASQVLREALNSRAVSTPAEVVNSCEAIKLAFPNRDQWAQTDRWAAVQTSTSAEEFIKRCGLGVNGHWCGQRWVQGTEKDCASPFHRGSPAHEEVRSLIGTLGKAFGGQTIETGKKTVPTHVDDPANEGWSGWRK